MPELASYAWLITYDHIAEEGVEAPSNDNAKGMTGPRNVSASLVMRLAEAAQAGRTHAADFPDVQWFKIYDDDGEIYYTGVRTGESEYEDGFEPLEDFGTPNAGATEIRYLDVAKTAETGSEVWEAL